MLTTYGQKSPVVVSGPPRLDVAPEAGQARSLPPGLAAPPSVAPAPAVHAPLPAPASRPKQPNLMVRSVLGLRAFGRKEASVLPTPASKLPSEARPDVAPMPSMLGLKRSSTPPPPVSGGYGGLAPLGNLPPARQGSGRFDSRGGASDAEERGRRQTPSPLSSTPPRARVASSSGRKRRREESGESRWWIGALAALGVCAVVLGIVLVAVTVSRRGSDVPTPAAGTSAAASSTASAGSVSTVAMPQGRLLNDDERFKSLLAQVHGRGKESAEMRSLLQEQASIAAQALRPGCQGPQCAALAEVGKLVTATEKRRVRRRSRSPDAMRSRWLAGLEMPEIPVEDDPRVQKRFEFYTENPVGRETFQQMLFRCGAYKDAIQSALVRRGMPKDLIAVAYAESGCYPLAKSPMGAEGLWQFIPDAARAYHLRIIENVVDERHSPQKATEAAMQYLSDLFAKFGSWDLAFAGYNMGPFGLATRLERVEGENVGFWELVDASMLPGETADYAPGIQAIALILNNLQRLKFGAIQQRAPQMTMDLPVPPTTRLTLVARAAALSLDELHRLNLDLKGTSTPSVQNFAVQVPKDSVWQARDTLQELLKSGDQSDLCAPRTFDWGRQRFTPEMQQACARNLAARGAAPSADSPTP
ncbi:MAG TPA: transglycosylase SLT domain-containing protein [Polyangiaceae bacterium]